MSRKTKKSDAKANNVKIEPLDFIKDDFINRTTLLLGASETGKTKIILDILHLIKDDVPICYAFSPTNEVNDTFTKIIPKSFIDNDVDVEKLESIIKRQEIRLKIYKRCNNKNILTDIALKLNPSINDKINVINMTYAESIKRLNGNHEKIESLSKKYDDVIIQTLKKHIKDNLYAKNKLSEEERNIIDFLDINIKICLILDDCAATARVWGKSETIKKIFYQGRHYGITTIISLQNDKEVVPAIRQNAFHVFFTTQPSFNGYFTSKENGFSKEQKANADAAGNEIFKKVNGKDTFKKPYYNRLKDKMYYHKATLHPKFIYNSELFEMFNDKEEDTKLNLTNNFIKTL